MKGHLGAREMIVIALLIVGVAAAVFLLMGGSEKPLQNLSKENVSPADATAPEPPAPVAAPPPEPQAQPEPARNMTNSSVGELLAAASGRLDTAYYKEPRPPSGELKTESFRWSLSRLNETPESIPLKENDIRVSYIRFDGRYIDGLRGFEIKTYETVRAVAPVRVFASAVFITPATPIDDHLDDSALSIRYDPHPEGSQILENCSVIGVYPLQTASGADLRIYDFSCKIMYGANP
ncbi:MAG: hypothetical protein U0R44_01910 [Candidatus Micrarchaeia archaeon]